MKSIITFERNNSSVNNAKVEVQHDESILELRSHCSMELNH